MLFIDLPNSREKLDHFGSKCNYMEASATIGLLKLLSDQINGMACRIGIISPYKSQVRLLRTKIGSKLGIEVNTVDAFQGREK